MTRPSDSLPPEVLAAFERHQPIEAIKLLLRMRAGGHKAAAPRPPAPHHMVAAPPPAAAAPKHPNADLGGLSPGEVPHSESAVWWWVIAVLLVYLAFRVFRG